MDLMELQLNWEWEFRTFWCLTFRLSRRGACSLIDEWPFGGSSARSSSDPPVAPVAPDAPSPRRQLQRQVANPSAAVEPGPTQSQSQW
ncbi:GM12688 [Drosophila sechellia]|uniref:GM12688 n=1 Tax=Drosophila sechellia TaxID=7238 RepID=B4I0Z2_DROSE|nr:GM12688 [Drosophila sechellia]